MNTLKELKNNNEDFEWYPTTNEILYCIEKDLIQHIKKQKCISYRRDGIQTTFDYETKTDIIKIDSFLDIGAGDGRVLDYFNSNQFRIKSALGIELARTQADNLIRRNIGLIGRDYFETVLIDKYYNVVFSNPPYSIYKMWCQKLLHEVNAEYIYLVIPERFINDEELMLLIKSKGQYEIIGRYDFLNADREARAKVSVIRIFNEYKKENNDTFIKWVNENIGEFKENKKQIVEENFSDINKNLSDYNENKVETMVSNYNRELSELLETYRAIARLDFSLLKSLGLCKQDVINKIKSDIETLKNKYWLETFNHIEAISIRLTYKTRKELFEKIQWFKELDFNMNNVYTIVVWVIENFNNYTKQQLLKSFNDLTNFDQVRAYKSNDKWFDAGWRYSKKQPEKYSLDYRIVVYCGYSFNDRYGYHHDDDNPAADLSIVARSLGFDNNGIETKRPERGTSYKCLMKDGNVLFEYRVYQNNNVHFKLNKEFLKVFNIEVGKVNNWIHNTKDVCDEFDMTESEAKKYFENNNVQLMKNSDKLLLEFK